MRTMKVSICLLVSLAGIALGAPVEPLEENNHVLVRRDMEGLGSLLKNLGNSGGSGGGGGNDAMANLMKQFNQGQTGGGQGGMGDLMKKFGQGGDSSNGGGGMADIMKKLSGNGAGGGGTEGSPLAGIMSMVKNLMGGKDIGEVLKGLTGGKGGGLDFSKMFSAFGGSKEAGTRK